MGCNWRHWWSAHVVGGTLSHVKYNCCQLCSHMQPFRASENLSSDRLLPGQAAGATATKGLNGSTVDTSSMMVQKAPESCDWRRKSFGAAKEIGARALSNVVEMMKRCHREMDKASLRTGLLGAALWRFVALHPDTSTPSFRRGYTLQRCAGSLSK